MEDKQILELILGKLNAFEQRFDSIDSRLDKIEGVQTQHTQKLDTIREQTAINTELKSVVDELVKDKELIKRILSN